MGRSGRVGRGGENDQNILYKILEELTKIGKKKKNYKCTWNREEFSPPQKQKTKLKKNKPSTHLFGEVSNKL